MTEREAENIRNAATVQVLQARKTLAVMTEKLDHLKREIVQVARDVQVSDARSLATTEFHPYPWWSPEIIRQEAQDVLQAQSEMQEAESRARSLGALLPE